MRDMGAELYRQQPVFREAVDRCAEVVGKRLGRPLMDVLLGDDKEFSLINDTAYTQPALFAVQAGLVALWQSWGIVPDVVLGHSVGEFAAAYCAGVYTLEQALGLARRSCLSHAGSAAGRRHGPRFLPRKRPWRLQSSNVGRKDIAIAALNGPQNTVVSGARDAVTALVAHFECSSAFAASC